MGIFSVFQSVLDHSALYLEFAKCQISCVKGGFNTQPGHFVNEFFEAIFARIQADEDDLKTETFFLGYEVKVSQL